MGWRLPNTVYLQVAELSVKTNPEWIFQYFVILHRRDRRSSRAPGCFGQDLGGIFVCTRPQLDCYGGANPQGLPSCGLPLLRTRDLIMIVLVVLRRPKLTAQATRRRHSRVALCLISQSHWISEPRRVKHRLEILQA